MRTLVTFILRLWVDARARQPAWEGQVECVSSDQRAHVCNLADLARFIEAETNESRRARHPNSHQQKEE